RKVYWALAEGEVQPEEGTWRDWLRKLPEESRTERVQPDVPFAKEAITDYRVLRRGDGVTLLELAPQTGRMHQLRVQSALRGWSILGDQLYGGRRPFGPVAELPRDRIVALHARSLTFTHPFRKEQVALEAPLPALWDEVLPPGR